MPKVIIKRLDSVTSNDTTATKLINENFENIQKVIENTLSRDGITPNYMDAVLDMNSHKIINTASPENDLDLINLKYLKEYVGDASEYATSAELNANKAENAAVAASLSENSSSASAQVAKGFADEATAAAEYIKETVADPSVKIVADNINNIKDTAMIKEEITAVSENMDSVLTVASDIADIKNTSDNIESIKDVADNIEDIKIAVVSANNAKESETNARIWAEGTDSEVSGIGGDKSAKGWAMYAQSVTDISEATEETAGIIKIATEKEALGGLDNSTAITPYTATKLIYDNVGRGIQLGFVGTLEGNLLTFETTDPSPYTLRHNYDYEIDLLFEAVGELPDSIEIVIKNGEDYINIVNVLHDDYTSHITVGDLKQIMKYSTNIGWRWIFMSRYAITASGEKVFVMPSTVVNVAGEGIYNKLHDALIANPDMIRYENDVNLVRILAGSTFVKPNGANNFERITLSTNVSTNVLPDHDQLIFSDGTHLYYIDADKAFSQATAPTAYEMMLWYDTTENKIKYTGNSGATWQEGYCFPFGTANSSGIIDCFCNGFGYFASCVWILDGVKVLIPNGKNADGTFNNILHTVSRIIVKTFDDTREGQWALTTSNDIFIGTQGFELTKDNKVINIVSGGIVNGCPMGDFKTNVGRVEVLTIRDILDLAEDEGVTIEYLDD